MAKKVNKNNLTLEEYIQHKIDSVRNAAFEKSKIRKIGVKIPYTFGNGEKEVLEKTVDKFKEAVDTSFIGALTLEQYYRQKAITNYDRGEYYQAKQELNDNCKYGFNCIATATDNYPETSRTNTNKDFSENFHKYGFKRINLNDALPGDIVNTPLHGMIYVGMKNGRPIFNYSDGGITEYDYKQNAHYPSEHYNAYRYVGTPELIEQWTNEYNENKKKMGGKQKKIITPNIIRGGAAIPLGDNIYLLKGKKHSQGGIDIGKDLEAEADEVVKMNPKSIKVVTAQKIMGSKSPAELVVNASSTGEQEEVFNDVFKYQEKFKDRNGLNDDGTRKAQFGKEVKNFNDKMLYNPKQKKEIKIQPPLEIRQKHLKQRNYIGGKPDEARRKALNMMPKVKTHIEQLAKTYGIDKNVLTHRFLREGWVDKAIKEYNNSNSLKQKEFFDKAILKGVNGFESLGLDDAATLIDKGKYNLRKELPFWVIDGENEKGRKVWSIYAHNLYDALEFKAADMEYRQNELRKRGISKEDINTYLNAAYNMGLYHKDLNNKGYINKNYKVPNYYKLGGMKQFKDRKKAAGGGAWASLIGEYGVPAVASTTQLINAGLKFPVDLGSVIGANVYTKKQLDKIKEATLDYNTETYDAQTKYNKDKYDKLNELLDKYYKEDLADLERHKIVRKDAIYSPIKLKTRININPQLQQIQRERDRNIRSIVENTASSKDALNRIRLENLEARDKNVAIQGQKENIETQLINQDLLQRKATMEKQVDANLRLDELRARDLIAYYNNLANLKKGYNQNKLQSTLKNLEDVFNTENLKRTSDFNAESSYRQGRMQNRINLIQGISDSVGQFLSEVNNSAMTAARLQTMQDAYGNNRVNPQTSFSPVGIQSGNSQYFGNSGQNSVMTKEQFDKLYDQILSRGYNLELGRMGGKFKVKRRNK